jgi:hypothetical protein
MSCYESVGWRIISVQIAANKSVNNAINNKANHEFYIFHPFIIIRFFIINQQMHTIVIDLK